MKYVISWRERPAASFRDYESAHERVLAIFKDWKMPASITIHQFVVRVGDYGGYMVIETDKPTDIHYFTSFLRYLNSRWTAEIPHSAKRVSAAPIPTQRKQRA